MGAGAGRFGACLFVWGLRTWEPLHVVVYRAEVQHQPDNLDYRIAISNKLYHPRQVLVRVTGLNADDYHWGRPSSTCRRPDMIRCFCRYPTSCRTGYTPLRWK